jgi:hypothetical protein
MVAVEDIHKGPARLRSLDQSMSHEAIENVLHAGIRSPRQARQLAAAARRRGTCERNEHVDVDVV